MPDRSNRRTAAPTECGRTLPNMARHQSRRAWPAAVLAVFAGGCGLGLDEERDVEGIPRSSIDLPDLPGRSVSYLSAGEPDAPLVILIHGTPGSAVQWARFLSDPVPGLRTIAIDRPGFGQSVSDRDH